MAVNLIQFIAENQVISEHLAVTLSTSGLILLLIVMEQSVAEVTTHSKTGGALLRKWVRN